MGFIAIPSAANQRLGLHVTSDELAIWQTRMVSGPYKSAGDVSSNSPGDWDRILSNADDFVAGNTTWAGQTVDTCATTADGPFPGNGEGNEIKDAAFVYLLTGTTSYRTAVLNNLLAQAAVAGTDFSNTTRWCTSGGGVDDGWQWKISNWLTRLLIAYDYIRPGISGGNQATLDTWFLNAAVYWEYVVDQLVLDAFPDRNTDNYTTPTDSGLSTTLSVLYYGGPASSYWHEHWNNRSATIVRFFTLVGVMQNNATLKNQGKRWFQEWMQYQVYSDNTAGEFYRWITDAPGLGWNYAGHVIGSMVTVADALARVGDTSLYDYSTSNGRNGTSGGPKTLNGVLTNFMQHVDHTIVRYGTDIGGNNGNVTYRIDSIDGLSQEYPRIHDTYQAMSNLYYQDAYRKTVYMRTASGAPAYPAVPAAGGWEEWGGEWGILPGSLFMFGQMEGVVDPYP